ncbi:MAG TPA: hypothetical protein VI933_01580 [archaeon]|nr:hypothetical protein [archaeon]
MDDDFVSRLLKGELSAADRALIEALKSARMIGIGGGRNAEGLATQEKYYRERVEDFLKISSGRRFLITRDFYDHCMSELYETMRNSNERAAVAFFAEDGSDMVLRRFIGYKELFRNKVCRSEIFSVMLIPNPTGGDKTNLGGSYNIGIEWFGDKVEDLIREAKERKEYPLFFHTHPAEAYPSEGDLQTSYIGGIIGFSKPSPRLKEMAFDSIASYMSKKRGRVAEVRETPEEVEKWLAKSDESEESKRSLIERARRDGGVTVSRPLPYEVPRTDWNSIISDDGPTVRLFYCISGQTPTQVPFYLEGRALP